MASITGVPLAAMTAPNAPTKTFAPRTPDGVAPTIAPIQTQNGAAALAASGNTSAGPAIAGTPLFAPTSDGPFAAASAPATSAAAVVTAGSPAGSSVRVSEDVPVPLGCWQNADACWTCGVRFVHWYPPFYPRQHHCRGCRKSFCAEHCELAAVPFIGPDPVRACARCRTLSEAPFSQSPSVPSADSKQTHSGTVTPGHLSPDAAQIPATSLAAPSLSPVPITTAPVAANASIATAATTSTASTMEGPALSPLLPIDGVESGSKGENEALDSFKMRASRWCPSHLAPLDGAPAPQSGAPVLPSGAAVRSMTATRTTSPTRDAASAAGGPDAANAAKAGEACAQGTKAAVAAPFMIRSPHAGGQPLALPATKISDASTSANLGAHGSGSGGGNGSGNGSGKGSGNGDGNGDGKDFKSATGPAQFGPSVDSSVGDASKTPALPGTASGRPVSQFSKAGSGAGPGTAMPAFMVTFPTVENSRPSAALSHETTKPFLWARGRYVSALKFGYSKNPPLEGAFEVNGIFDVSCVHDLLKSPFQADNNIPSWSWMGCERTDNVSEAIRDLWILSGDSAAELLQRVPKGYTKLDVCIRSSLANNKCQVVFLCVSKTAAYAPITTAYLERFPANQISLRSGFELVTGDKCGNISPLDKGSATRVVVSRRPQPILP